jgi:hypothetical protein
LIKTTIASKRNRRQISLEEKGGQKNEKGRDEQFAIMYLDGSTSKTSQGLADAIRS